MQARVMAACLILLSGCADSEPAPTPGPQEQEPATQQVIQYHNHTARNAGFMGIDGTLFLTAGPGPATVPERIHTLSHEGELLAGNVTVSWSSTSAPGMEMVLALVQDGTELERVQGTGPLRLDLPEGAQGASLLLQPAGPVGAHLLVQWDLEIKSQWLE